MSAPRLVGLVGFAQSGKDTVAATLTANGYTRVAFADPIRDLLYRLDPLLPHGGRLADTVDRAGWEGAKQEPEVRRLLQRLGTEAGRAVLGEDVWLLLALRRIRDVVAGGGRVVMTDVRFRNEYDLINERGGEVWLVDRPRVGAVNGHASETLARQAQVGDLPVHARLVNDGSLEDLAAEVTRLLRSDWL